MIALKSNCRYGNREVASMPCQTTQALFLGRTGELVVEGHFLADHLLQDFFGGVLSIEGVGGSCETLALGLRELV